MEQEKLDFFSQSEKILKLILGGKDPEAEQISLLAIKLRQTFEDGIVYASQNHESM